MRMMSELGKGKERKKGKGKGKTISTKKQGLRRQEERKNIQKKGWQRSCKYSFKMIFKKRTEKEKKREKNSASSILIVCLLFL